jgi:cell division initiation protein
MVEKFRVGLSGYNKEDVNKFVADVTAEYESLLNKLKESDEKVQSLEAELVHYKQLESSLNRAIMLAEETTNNIRKSAYDESRVIVDDAKKNASRIVNSALLRAESLERDNESLRRKVASYKKRFKDLLEENLDELDKIDETL